MNGRLRSWQLPLILVAACALIVAGVSVFYQRRSASQEWLFRRLPAEGALLVGIDVKALRTAGILDELAGRGMDQEADYRYFVEQTGFDYRTDLDYVALAWTPQRRDILARGSFNWSLISKFATSRSGRCFNMFCDVDGSAPGRKISFFPAARDVLAVSVAQQAGAAWALAGEPDVAVIRKVRGEPLWLSMEPEWIDQLESNTPGLRTFANALSGADRIELAVGVAGSGLELRLDAMCLSAEKASAIHGRLSSATELLRSMLSRQGMTPNPNDVSGLLASGTFQITGNSVQGRWTLTREFLSGLTRGLM